MGKTRKLYDLLGCNVKIPLNDLSAWKMYPDHNWIYNRLEIAIYQKLKCAPMPIQPKEEDYPIIIKPMINLYGMGHKVIKINNYDEFEKEWDNNNTDFWCQFLDGDHKSWDFVINKGKILYHVCFLGHKNNQVIGQFDCWESIDEKIPKKIKKFLQKEFTEYIGCINIETIGNKMIECHLRMGDIDFFPTTKILKGIISNYYKNEYSTTKKIDDVYNNYSKDDVYSNYNNLSYRWTKVKFQKVYMFPLWFKNPNKEIYDHCYNFKHFLDKNKKVLEYEIDEDYLCKPGQSEENRIMWFTCEDYDFGQSLRKELIDELNVVYQISK